MTNLEWLIEHKEELAKLLGNENGCTDELYYCESADVCRNKCKYRIDDECTYDGTNCCPYGPTETLLIWLDKEHVEK